MTKYRANTRTTIGLGLLRLYPRRWRDRYHSEVAALFAESAPGWGALADLAGHAIWERRYLLGAILRAFVVTCIAGLAVSGALQVTLMSAPTWSPSGVATWLFFAGRYSIDWMLFVAHPRYFILSAVLFGYSLLYSAPIGLLLAVTGVGQRAPRLAKMVWLASFLAFVLWVSFGPYRLHQTAMVYGLAAGGWVLARRLFVAPIDASPGSPRLSARFADRLFTSRDRSVDPRSFLQVTR